MKAPVIKAVMDRRILVNYRVDPDVLAAFLPAPFRPTLVGGYGMAGICLIRLGAVRPAPLPAALGITSENAAHRVAVEWDTADGPVAGVYIHRRDTSSRLVDLAGGRAFPGWHHRARFRVAEQAGAHRVEVRSQDGLVDLAVEAHVDGEVMPGSVFATVKEASSFFRCAPVGYAATPAAGVFDGVELTAEGWSITPLRLDEVRSSLFDRRPFGPGVAAPDSAFLMAGMETTWRAQPALTAAAAASPR